MITELPPIFEGYHWCELSPREGRNRWRFSTMGPGLRVKLDLPLTDHITFHDHKGRHWASFEGPEFWVLPEYWSNGNSPKRHVPLLGWIGTPDFKGDVDGLGGNLLAAFVHDPMRQFLETEHFPLTRLEVDQCFYDLNRLSGFPLALPYFVAVNSIRCWPAGEGGYSTLVRP